MHVTYQVSQNLALQMGFTPVTFRSAFSHVEGEPQASLLQQLKEAHCKKAWAQGSNKFSFAF